MSWTSDSLRIWKCSDYADLNYTAISNLAEYGQPVSPYEKGFVQDFDFDPHNVVVQMSQFEVMTHGYGRAISPESFPIVRKFLLGTTALPVGIFDFDGLVRQGFASQAEKKIKTDLYGDNTYHITPGSIGAADAAYIHGNVAFGLMSGTRFFVEQKNRRIDAEIGALDDNWDFTSNNNVVNVANKFLAAIVGPDHYNLEAPIEIQFRGAGKRMTVEKRISSGAQDLFRLH